MTSLDNFDGQQRLSVIGGLDYWNGLLEWTTGMDFDLFLSFPQELYIEEVEPYAGLAFKVVLARAVPSNSTRALDFMIETKPRPRATACDDPLPNNIILDKIKKALQMSINLHLTVIDTQMTVLRRSSSFLVTGEISLVHW